MQDSSGIFKEMNLFISEKIVYTVTNEIQKGEKVLALLDSDHSCDHVFTSFAHDVILERSETKR
ncbi:hypothetical protein HYU92_05990 [Candidatus Curtissbacteria bacterium]|nr:hypothetical protein [Candidatus Curtissbacteria bacterium]